MTPYYQDESVTLFHGDCREVLPGLLSAGVELVVTSPPYNLGGEPWPHLGNWKPGDSAGGRSKWKNGSDAGGGIQYSSHEDTMPWPQYAAWQREILALLWNIIPDDGAIFYNHKPRVIGARLWMPLELLPMNVVLRQIIIWSMPGGMNFNPTAFVPTHEWLMLLAKPEFRLRSRGASGVGDVWTINRDYGNPHPAPFPVQLASNAIDTSEAKIVLDPFSGSGSTLVAAKLSGRCAIGIEIDESYCEIAANRLRQKVFAWSPSES